MPQLDVSSFTSQILWLVTIYFTFYIIILKFVLPRIARILKLRESQKLPGVKAFEKKANKIIKEVDSLDKSIFLKVKKLNKINAEILKRSAKKLKAVVKSEKELKKTNKLLNEASDFFKNQLKSTYIKKALLENKNSEND